MHVHKLVALLIWLFLPPGFAWGRSIVPKDLPVSAKSVVTIIVLDRENHPISTATGFFIDKGGRVVTCHHVFAGSFRAVVKSVDGRTGEVLEIQKDSPELDLAVARTQLKNMPGLPVGDSEKIRVGEKIYVLGDLRKFHVSLSIGTISAIRNTRALRLIQITAPISAGFSGGPVLDKSSEVIGIANAFIEREPNLNFALPVNYLKTLELSKSGVSALPALSFHWKATIKDHTLVDIFPVRTDHEQQGGIATRRNLNSRRSDKGTVVYFKNGKKLTPDIAWRKGNMVFVVVHGKDFAVGYNERLVDFGRSSPLSFVK